MGKRGGAGTVYSEKPAQEKADGTVVKAWQRMPTQLLLEWTQQQKRPKPYYNKARSWDAGKFRQKVWLEDPKNKEASLEFASATDADSLFEAKEQTALVALLKLQSSLPLERKLPPPYCDIWKASVAAAAASASGPKGKGKSDATTEKGKGKGSSTDGAGQSTKGGGKASSNNINNSNSNNSSNSAGADAGTATRREAEQGSWETGQSESGGGKSVGALYAASYYTSKAEKSAAERQRDVERRQERNKREAARENKRRANPDPPILLSKRMRTQLYSTLGLGEAYGGGFDDVPVEEIDEVESKAVNQCEDWGFDSNDALRAVAATREEGFKHGGNTGKLAEALRKWLCLHLPEDELPEEFAAGRGQFDVYKGAPKGPGGAGSSKAAPKKSAFEVALDGLLAEVKEKLEALLPSSDAEGTFLNVEMVLRGFDFDTADEEDLKEAPESVAALLSVEAEAEALEPLTAEIAEKWKSLLEIRAAQPAAPEKGDGKEKSEGQQEVDIGAESTVASNGDIDRQDGFWEDTFISSKPTPSSSSTAGAGKGQGKSKPRGPWFGYGDGATAAANYEKWAAGPSGQRMVKLRGGLPAAKSREELLGLVAKHQVLLIQGETGCGKTTQVGQFLIEGDQKSRVIVTQPRRVAAVSVAARVAEERGEKLGTGTVGYSVRGDSQLQRDSCRLLFCTNGILLRRLLGDPDEMFSDKTCTHLVIDEVHERSVEIDLLLTLLCHKLQQRPNLRVLLMSATMDVEQLSGLFKAKPPVVKIPGRTFPVSQLYLEDAEDLLGIFKRDTDEYDEMYEAQPVVEKVSADEAEKAAYKALQVRLDFQMLAKLVLAAIRGELKDCPKEGAVLVFVPGVGEISRLISEIQRTGTQGLLLLPLHGALPSEQQRRCFEVPGKNGPRKVVISTNVAETSVTVPDVTIVIDTARERRLVLDPGAVAPCLAERVCAQSSLRQRKGRAGRVQKGLCLTMLPRRLALSLPAEAAPEMLSAPLESLCLQVRVAGFEPTKFLARAPTPPEPQRVDSAEKMLLKIGAARRDAEKVEVSALGRHLAALPCDVHIGKLLVLGAFLGVASAAADIASMLSVRSPLKSTQHDQQAERSRIELRNTLRPGGGKSDHCLLAALMAKWLKDRSNQAHRQMCQTYGLAFERMAEASSVRSQLAGGLKSLGFAIDGEDDRCGSDWKIVRAAVCGAFFPQIARVDRPPKEYIDSLAGAIEKQTEARRLRYFILTDSASDSTVAEEDDESVSLPWRRQEMTTRAFLHPSSVLFKESSYSCPYVVFSSKQAQEARGDKPSRINLSDTSEASVYALLLFGGRLRTDTTRNAVSVDKWITLSGGNTTVVALMEKLRKEIDALLLKKVADPRVSLAESKIASSVGLLISSDGLG